MKSSKIIQSRTEMKARQINFFNTSSYLPGFHPLVYAPKQEVKPSKEVYPCPV